MAYSPTSIAKKATDQFSASLKDKKGRGMFTNDLDAYVTSQLRKDYKDVTGYSNILNKMNAQSDAAWDLARAQQLQAMNAAETQNYADTQTAIAQMRNALQGSASSGANRGAANATALQALLGLGQQTAQTTTEGMQGYQNAAREAAAARAANAVNALESAREGMNSMYENATSAYGADHTYGVQGVAEALGSVASGSDTAASNERSTAATNASNERVNTATNASNERMNTATNNANVKIANTTTKSKQTIINKK